MQSDVVLTVFLTFTEEENEPDGSPMDRRFTIRPPTYTGDKYHLVIWKPGGFKSKIAEKLKENDQTPEDTSWYKCDVNLSCTAS
jgi:hypothetical protein